MPVDLVALLDDLDAETAALREILEPLRDSDWQLATPAPGWSIGDQVAHLAYFDDMAVSAATRPEEFAVIQASVADGAENPDTIAARYRHLSPAQLRDWFGRARADGSRPAKVASSPADGDLGARPGHRGHDRVLPRAHRQAPARRAHRRGRAALQLRRARPAGARRAAPCRADYAVG